MSDLPPLTNNPLQLFINEIKRMQRAKSQNREKPHKLVLLLAVINLFERGVIRENRIYFNEELVQEFNNIFRYIARKDDWCQPGPPFFHLRTSGFWNHKIFEGREDIYATIKTSGGGYLKIIENIDYAYLSEYAFKVMISPELRNALKDVVILLINPEYIPKGGKSTKVSEKRARYTSKTPEEQLTQRIGTMFHETLSLNRDGIRQILLALSQNNGIPQGDTLGSFFEKLTNLGSNYIKAMPQYARGCGLIDFDFRITNFGKKAIIFDSQLLTPSTQWLMHFNMSSPNGPGPLFWNKLITNYFNTDIRFSEAELIPFLSSSVESKKGGAISEDSWKSTRAVFLGSYTKQDGLANLNLLQKDEERGEYQVNYPEPPSVWVMGVALLHYWRTMFPDQKMIEMKDLVDESDFARIFMVGTRRINKMLEAMRRIGYVELFTTAPPYTVALLNDDVDPLLERMYAGDESE